MEGNVDMNAFDRLKILCDEQGISVNNLEEKLGIGKNSLYSWKKNVPKGSNLIRVADFFDVSTDYLLGRTDKKRFYEITENNDIETIAAHHEGDEWTKEELEEIERFKEFIRMKRDEHKQKG